MLKIILNFILFIFIFLFQVSFITAFQYPFNNINIILVIPIFILLVSDKKTAWIWGITTGIVMSSFSSFYAGVYFITFLITLGIIDFLFTTFFTNKSFYSFLFLSIVATLIFNLLGYFIDYILFVVHINNFYSSLPYGFIYNIIWKMFFSGLVSIVLFLIMNSSTKKLKTYLIFK